MSFGGGSQPSGNTTTTQTNNPWSGQQPYLQFGMQQAQNLYNTGGPKYYPGTTYAPATGAQTSALNQQAADYANGSPITGPAEQFINQSLGGSYLNANPANAALSPYTSGAMLSVQNPYFQNMAQQVAAATEPGITGQFTAGNSMNNPAAAYAVSNGLGNAIGSLAYGNYQQGQQNQLAATQQLGQNYNTAAAQQEQSALLAPGVSQMPAQDMANLYGAGAQQQQLSQNTIDDAINRYNYSQTEPYNLLNFFNQSVGGNYGGTSTLTSPYFQNSTANALSGGLGGAALGSMFGGSSLGAGLGLSSTSGGLLGGGAGLLFGLLSDRSTKDNVRRIGTADNGLPIYAFNYKGQQLTQIGFMADEVERLHPDAVIDVDGIKYVNYGAAVK